MAVSLIPILFYFFAAFSMVIGVAMFWIFKGRLDNSVRYWIGATLLSGVAASLTVLRGELATLISIVFANALNFGAYFLFAHSLRSLPSGGPRGSLPKPILYLLFGVAYFCVLAVLERETSSVFVKTVVAVAAALGSLWVFYAAYKTQALIKNNYLKGDISIKILGHSGYLYGHVFKNVKIIIYEIIFINF